MILVMGEILKLYCLEMQPKVGGKLHIKLNASLIPIVDNSRQRKCATLTEVFEAENKIYIFSIKLRTYN